MATPISSVGPALDIIASVIHLLTPSDLERLKTEIRKTEEERIERKKKLLEALASGDIVSVNALLFGD